VPRTSRSAEGADLLADLPGPLEQRGGDALAAGVLLVTEHALTDDGLDERDFDLWSVDHGHDRSTMSSSADR
jgi:hypothetical protein